MLIKTEIKKEAETLMSHRNIIKKTKVKRLLYDSKKINYE